MIAAWTLAGWMSDLSNTSSFLMKKRAHRRERRTSFRRQSEAPMFQCARGVLLMLLFLPTINLSNKGFKLVQTVYLAFRQVHVCSVNWLRPTRVLAYALAALLCSCRWRCLIIKGKCAQARLDLEQWEYHTAGGLGRRVRVETVWGNKPSVRLP